VSQVSGILATTAGIFVGLFALVMTTGSGISAEAILLTGAISIAFLVSGVLGAFGQYRGVLALVWLSAFAAFVFFAWGTDGGFMDGGIFIWGIFLYLVTGAALALVGWRRNCREFAANM